MEEKRVEDSTQSRTDTVGALVEKQQYLQHSNIDHHEDPWPLVWWKQNCSHLPMLQELAKKYLCIPATSVPAERLFSKAGEVVTKECGHVAVFKQEHWDILTICTRYSRT